MATREKSIQYAFATNNTVWTNNTTNNLSQITIYIPETGVTFKSVTADMAFMDVITATGGTIGEHRLGIRLGAAAYTTITELDDITQSGENISGIVGPFDFTSHFTTNWSGTSMTCDAQCLFNQTSGTTTGMINVNVVLTITYSYDDDETTNPTQIKTAWIPLESLTGSLPTVADSSFGTNQIPQLTSSGMLPEDSVVIRDYYFIIEGNTFCNGAVTDFICSVNIDSGTAYSFGYVENGLGSDRYFRWTWKPSVPSTTAAHDFQFWCNTATKMNHVTVTLVVTYAFNAAASTRILNSIWVPVEVSSPVGINTSAEASRFDREVFIEEPGTITMQQSAYRLNWNTSAAVAGISTRAGGQSFRGYTNLGNVICGMMSLQQRLDSGSAQGAGMTMARGRNTLVMDIYATDATDQMTNVNGYALLNYQSDKSPGGIGQHNHTVFYNMLSWDAALSDRNRINNYAIAIPETDYWLVSVGFIFYQWVATAGMAVTFDVECLSGEGKGGGYYDIYADAYQADAERACSVVFMRGRDVFKRWPQDPQSDRVNVETARDYRLFTTTTTGNGMAAFLTYHSFTFTAADSISGFSGTVYLSLCRASDGVKVSETTRVGDGAFSFTWYDDTEQMYVQANDGTNVGRSINTLCS